MEGRTLPSMTSVSATSLMIIETLDCSGWKTSWLAVGIAAAWWGHSGGGASETHLVGGAGAQLANLAVDGFGHCGVWGWWSCGLGDLEVEGGDAERVEVGVEKRWRAVRRQVNKSGYMRHPS